MMWLIYKCCELGLPCSWGTWACEHIPVIYLVVVGLAGLALWKITR